MEEEKPQQLSPHPPINQPSSIRSDFFPLVTLYDRGRWWPRLRVQMAEKRGGGGQQHPEKSFLTRGEPSPPPLLPSPNQQLLPGPTRNVTPQRDAENWGLERVEWPWI